MCPCPPSSPTLPVQGPSPASLCDAVRWREKGGGGSNRLRAPRAARTVQSRHVMHRAVWRAARTERQAEGRERAAWSEGGADRKRAEAESGKERMSRRGGGDRRGGRCVPGESGVRERERRRGRDWRGGRCEPGESGLEGGAGGETGVEGGAYRERAAQRAAKRAVVHELLLHKC